MKEQKQYSKLKKITRKDQKMSILISEENCFKSKLLQNPERLLNEDNRQFTTKYSKPRHIDTLKLELLSSGGNN